MQRSGAGGRQRGYHKAGRVKKAGSKWSESCRQSRETEYRETFRMSAGAKQDFAVSARKCAGLYVCGVNEVQVW